jgi:hypothetical protein
MRLVNRNHENLAAGNSITIAITMAGAAPEAEAAETVVIAGTAIAAECRLPLQDLEP